MQGFAIWPAISLMKDLFSAPERALGHDLEGVGAH
jgi:hypothetical protein